MKKVIVAISAIAMTVGANAQEFTSFKPFEGNFTTELGLTGGIFNSDVRLSEGALLRGRYFLTDRSALRLGINVSSQSDKENFWRDSSTIKGVETDRSSQININLGYEKHFKGTNRLSPYIGGDLMFGFGMSRTIGENTNGMIYVPDYSYKMSSGNFSWGVRGVVGADYYFAKNVYLGVEAGLGFMNQIDGRTKMSTTIGGQTRSEEFKSTGSTFNFAPSVVTGVRLGFVL